jgi:hypothetical protein
MKKASQLNTPDLTFEQIEADNGFGEMLQVRKANAEVYGGLRAMWASVL